MINVVESYAYLRERFLDYGDMRHLGMLVGRKIFGTAGINEPSKLKSNKYASRLVSHSCKVDSEGSHAEKRLLR